MARLHNTRAGSWPVIVGIGFLTLTAWGFYAWRFTGSPPSHARSANAVPNAGESSPADATAQRRITSLRAAMPASEADNLASRREPVTGSDSSPESGPDASSTATDPVGLSVSIAANAPPSAQEGIEMILGHGQPSSAGSALDELQAGRAALARGDLIAAREALSAVLDRGLGASEMMSARGELGRIADALLFSRVAVPDDTLTGVHVVNSGETLSAIARLYKVTEELLASINEIADPDQIYAGAHLKVIHGPFRAVIHKSEHRLDVYLGGVFVRSFGVGLGTNGGTPLGTWIVIEKLRNPEWTDPLTGRRYLADDPDNPIGERWIGLHGIDGECVGRDGFGIHGTIDPASIGENFSMGCIRLLPDDVAFVYDLLVNQHSHVIIE